MLQFTIDALSAIISLGNKGYAMADALGSVGQRVSNSLGRLQQAETGPAMEHSKHPQETKAAPSNSVLVSVKAQNSQAGVNGNGAQAASGYKSALGRRLSNSLTRFKNESEQIAKIAEEDVSKSNSSPVEVQISRAARQIYSDKSVDEVSG
jgi:hypothetical protein